MKKLKNLHLDNQEVILDKLDYLEINDPYNWCVDSLVYRRLRKTKLASCDYCAWNKGCNKRRKQNIYGNLCYSTYSSCKHKSHRIKNPNWKLISKNSRQWEPKTLKKEFNDRYPNFFEYIV